MIFKILGLIDLCIALMLFIANSVPQRLIGIASVYLLIKGLIFVWSEDTASYIDVAIGIYLIFLMFNLQVSILTFLSALFLVQKGLLSIS